MRTFLLFPVQSHLFSLNLDTKGGRVACNENILQGRKVVQHKYEETTLK